ncbi:MAG: DNA polymerase III subunit delta, partial [Alphaproteobacteria bacterium]
MKINSGQLNVWLKSNHLAAYKLFLVFGPDEAGVSYNTSCIEKGLMALEEASIVRIAFKEIKDNISSLADHLNAQSLFGEKTIIALSDVPTSTGKQFLDFVKTKSWHNRLILISEDLKPASALRKLGETDKDILTVACYKEDARQIEGFISAYIKEQGYNADMDVPSEIARVMPTNKMLIKNELDKLMLYKLDEKRLTIEDVIEVLSNGKELELDNLCVAVALKRAALVKSELERAEHDEISPIMILRVLQKYCVRLKDIVAAKEKGTNVEAYIAKLMPPVFFKAKDNLVAVAKKVSYQQVLELLDA